MIILLAASSFPLQKETKLSPTRSSDTPTAEIAKNIFDQVTNSLSLPSDYSVSGPMLVNNAPIGTFELYLLGKNLQR